MKMCHIGRIPARGGGLLLHRQPAGAFLIFHRGAQGVSAVNRPVLRFGNLGALHLVEAPVSSTEQNGSE